MTPPISPRDLMLLSAYLDHELSPRQQARLEARLRSDPVLAGVLAELRRTRAVLRSTPRLRAPRRFTLTPAMVPARPLPRRYPALGFASALASLLFVLAVLGDALGLASPRPALVALQAQPSETPLSLSANAAPTDLLNKSSDTYLAPTTLTVADTLANTAIVETLPPPAKITASYGVTSTEETIVETVLVSPGGRSDFSPTGRYPGASEPTAGFAPGEVATPTLAWIPVLTVTQMTTQTVEAVGMPTALPSESPLPLQETPLPVAKALSPTDSPIQPQPVPVPKDDQPLARPSSLLIWRLGEAVLLIIALVTGAWAIVLYIRARR